MGLVGSIGKKPLSGGGIHQILKNPLYYGYIKYSNQEAWGNHEPMITALEYRKVLDILSKSGRAKDTNCEFAYSGLMKCGVCNHAITAEEKVKYKCPKCNKRQTAKHPKKCSCGYMITKKDIQKGNFYTYYHCAKPKVPCAKKFINATVLDPQFNKFISGLSLDAEYLEWAKPWMKFMENEVKKKSIENKVEKDESLDIDQKLSELLEMRLNGEIDSDMFRKKKNEFEIQKRSIKEEGENTRETTKRLHENIEHLIDLKKRYENAPLKEKKHILKKLSSNPRLKDEKLDIKAKKLYVTLNSLRKHKNSNIEPLKNRSESGLSVDYDDCYHKWYWLYNCYETDKIN